jgi:hypothetical protein
MLLHFRKLRQREPKGPIKIFPMTEASTGTHLLIPLQSQLDNISDSLLFLVRILPVHDVTILLITE